MSGKYVIHPTAVVDSGAEIGEGVEIGPYAVIGGNVIIGANTKIYPHVVIDGFTTIGEGCQIFPSASIGLPCQDFKYRGEKTYVRIGTNTIIRECVTINSSLGEESETVIGNNCFLMAYVHVAHNCRIGDNVIMANVASLSGYTVIEDKAFVSGLVAVHQFVNIGTMSITGGGSKVNQDVPPYALSDGNPCSVRDINSVGLTRHGVPLETRNILRRAFKILFKSGLSMSHAIEKVQSELPQIPEIMHLIDFI